MYSICKMNIHEHQGPRLILVDHISEICLSFRLACMLKLIESYAHFTCHDFHIDKSLAAACQESSHLLQDFYQKSCTLRLQRDCHMLATELLATHKTLHSLWVAGVMRSLWGHLISMSLCFISKHAFILPGHDCQALPVYLYCLIIYLLY